MCSFVVGVLLSCLVARTAGKRGTDSNMVSFHSSEASSFEVKLNDLPYNKKFESDVLTRCVGSSHASTALRADWQAQLSQIKMDLDFEYIRFHGLLDDDSSFSQLFKFILFQNQRITIPFKDFFFSLCNTVSVVIKNRNLDVFAQTPSFQSCIFKPHVDYCDPPGPVFNASSKEDCCTLCYKSSTGLPNPCVAAVYAPEGKCYTKLATNCPLNKTSLDIQACITNRTSPKGYMYSWVNIFKVFDFLRSIKMRPVVELSFMPSLLASEPTLVGFWYRGGRSPPRDFAEWQDFIKQLTEALIGRYGADELRKWYFEIWNEPNCGFYATAPCCGPTCGNQTAYMELFKSTYDAIKSVDAKLQVGGPATAQLAWLDDFIESAAEQNCRPDFVSSHLYPTDPFISQDRNGFATAIEEAVKTIQTSAAKVHQNPAPPLLITEFNCGLGINCADAPYAGSFVAHHTIMAQKTTKEIRLQSYWTFSDIFEEQGQVPSEFSQAFGMQSINGIPKPVYRALELIKRLHPVSFPVIEQITNNTTTANTSVEVVATMQNTSSSSKLKSVEILVTNHVGGPARQPSPSDPAVNVTLYFTNNIPIGHVIEIRRVDANHSNALNLYNNVLDRPPYPSAPQIASLNKASLIHVEHLKPTIIDMQDWQLSLNVPSFSVTSISFNVSVEEL